MITSKDYDQRVITQGLQFLADTYYEPKGIFEKRRIDIIMEILSPKPGETILDIGCGVGTFAYQCAKCGAKAFGIDYSLESIKAADKLCDRFKVKQNTGFFVANARELPFRGEYFDKITAIDFIEHITLEEKKSLLGEIYRILKPKGTVIIFTPNGKREKLGNIYWKIRNLLFGDKIPTTELHFGLTYRAEFEKICRQNNFKYKLLFKDVTRPYLAKIPLLRNILVLNLLWIIKKV